MRKVLARKFFNRAGDQVAKELLGKYVVRKDMGGEEAFMITEVELYDGHRDRASHAFKGKTARTAPMFGPPGHLYTYLIYGMYVLLNVTVREVGYPSAILIRAVEGISGPGRLGKHLNLTLDLTGRKASKASGLWFEDRGVYVSRTRIQRTARIGVAYAGSYWSTRLRRYLLKS